ncbi:MAG: prepilin-type N-terminal cleavage/methylation domain-containing protein [bacterium]
MNYKKGFTLIELLVVVAIIGVLASAVMSNLSKARMKGRDATRISQLRQIQNALAIYYNINGDYPQCLKNELETGCPSPTTFLQGAGIMTTIPNDPLTKIPYTYAARGSGANCNGYHLGASLEDKTNKILQNGADSPASPTVCTGSASAFSGLSYAAGGQQCNATGGAAQPQPASVTTAETCYDLVP